MCCKKNSWASTLIIVAAIIVLAAGYCLALQVFWLSKIRQAAVQPNIMLGGDRDAHGCIGSAGYSWCEDKQKCLRVWEEACAAENNPPTLPSGYTLESYRISEISNDACQKDSECVTPEKYLIQSSCPYTSLCLKNKCTVVCPDQITQAIPSGWKIYANTQYGFEIKYPDNFVFSNTASNLVELSATEENSKALLSFSISADNSVSSLNTCETGQAKKINDNVFYFNSPKGGQSMGGSIASTRDYQIIYNGYCYKTEEIVSWRQTQQVDINKSFEILDNIFSTFKFTK